MILGNKIIRKISGESFISNENGQNQNRKKNNNSNIFVNNYNYNNDFNFDDCLFDSNSPKDIFLSFENFDSQNKIDIFGEKRAKEKEREKEIDIDIGKEIDLDIEKEIENKNSSFNSIQAFNSFEEKQINFKDKESKDLLSEIIYIKNTEKISHLKDILTSKKFIDKDNENFINNDNDNTTVSTKKTKETLEKEKIKKVLLNENIYRDRDRNNNDNTNTNKIESNLSLRENDDNIKQIKIKQIFEKTNTIDSYKDKIFSDDKSPNNNIKNKYKEQKKLHENLLATAKYFNLDN